MHLKCMESWLGYTKSKSTGSVIAQISAQCREVIIKNQMYAKHIIDLILYLSRQGIPFRGHDEAKNSLNQGNFKEACLLRAQTDVEFKKKLSTSFNLTSPEIQNEIISICCSIVEKSIVSQIKEVGFVDVSEKQDSQTLADTILNFLSQLNLHDVPIIAQSYDGARVIMNLVVLDLCKNIECSNIFFNGIESLYVHFARTSNNKKLKDMQQIIGIKALTIMRISDTRWVCRYNNCKPVKDNYAAILKILSEEIYNNNDMDVAQAIGIQNDIIPVVDNNIFPKFYKLLQTALTIPISTASCERSFSVMRRIKNWTRNTLTNDRFTNMSILHIERDLSHEIESENNHIPPTPNHVGIREDLRLYHVIKFLLVGESTPPHAFY
ncbi:hypothetical protein AGLY_018048 [Aphis glycines]|uniref:HAT C-terminal dimerisation domain-containing protein n=1 Tax=Aphis glycines TaxID=307491 RepID=A0A6G0STR8_APHGL|nr:hypothetical protein AGLY_018048 [Aphis glycines]